MAIDIELRKQVEDAIEPYKDSTTEPPFSQGELIVMALLLHDEPLCRGDTMQWISDTFTHYRNLFSSAFCEQQVRPFGWKLRLDNANQWMKEFRRVTYDFELPVTTAGFADDGQTLRMATMPNATAYLQRALGKESTERKRTFPFLDLPAELRTTIYEMLLRFPSSGLYSSPHSRKGHRRNELTTITRDVATKFSFDIWNRIGCKTHVQTPRLARFAKHTTK